MLILVFYIINSLFKCDDVYLLVNLKIFGVFVILKIY